MKPPRKDAITLLVSGIGILGVAWIDDVRLWLGSTGIVCITLWMGASIVLGLLGLLPDAYWQYGVETHGDGFLFHQQLRKKRFIRYAAIERIVVSSVVDGGGESSSTWIVESSNGKARLDEAILYGSDIRAALQALPGFDFEALAKADVPEDSLLWSVISRKTVVLDRRGRNRQ